MNIITKLAAVFAAIFGKQPKVEVPSRPVVLGPMFPTEANQDEIPTEVEPIARCAPPKPKPVLDRLPAVAPLPRRKLRPLVAAIVHDSPHPRAHFVSRAGNERSAEVVGRNNGEIILRRGNCGTFTRRLVQSL